MTSLKKINTYLHVLIELELITFYLQTISIYTKATFTKVFEQAI